VRGRYEIPLFALNFDEREAQAAAETVRSGWISMGPRTEEFEARFGEHLGARHAIAVSSCTAALHLATKMLVEPGDEVIVPSLTFVATANAVRYAGGIPVFADVKGLKDLSIDPDDVAKKVTPRTRAILPMHYAGFSCEMDRLGHIAEEHGLAVIEDAAHAPASQFRGRSLGTLGVAGCFSFFSNKAMTCAEGGMLVTDNDELATRARLLRSHGMTSLSYSRSLGQATTYDVVEVGHNYRLDDIRSAIGLIQLEKLPRDVMAREQVRGWYVERLEAEPRITIPYLTHSDLSSHYIMPVVLNLGGHERRAAVRDHMAEEGIETSVHYPAVHRFQPYSAPATHLTKTEFVADHQLSLPLFSSLGVDQVDRICDALREALDRTQ
jgi:dTDP-4-amino-4,6-dideoxygalactose transaminase